MRPAANPLKLEGTRRVMSTGYKVEVKLNPPRREKVRHRDKSFYSVHRISDDGEDIVVLQGDDEFMSKLNDALKREGF